MHRATEGDEAQRITALREAVLAVPPFRAFLQAHSGKRLPAPAAMKAFLIAKAAVTGCVLGNEPASRLAAWAVITADMWLVAPGGRANKHDGVIGR